MIKVSLAALSLVAAAPALGASPSDIRSADARVVQAQKALATAQRSGDAVSVATERARLQGAKAVAWSRRHPAASPKARTAAR